jgi:hypothetical protein
MSAGDYLLIGQISGDSMAARPAVVKPATALNTKQLLAVAVSF